jgi:hypothetical protein
MTLSPSRLVVVTICVAIALFLVPATAIADTYQFFDLGTARPIYGIDTSGDVVIVAPGSCGMFDNPCYLQFHQGVVISIEPTPPALDYDNGTPCTPVLPPGTVISHGVCNGSLFAYGEVSPQLGLFAGTGFVHDGPVTFLVMNGSGDIAWSDGNDNTEAYDLTAHAPEPNTLTLFVIGAIGGVEAVRRRFGRVARLR